jgi:hypothetical protein
VAYLLASTIIGWKVKTARDAASAVMRIQDVGAAEGLNPGQVRQHLGSLDQWLVDLEEVRVTVDKQDLALERLISRRIASRKASPPMSC